MKDRIGLIPKERLVEFANVLVGTPELRLAYTADELREIYNRAEAARSQAKSTTNLPQLDGADDVMIASVLKVRDLAYPLDAVAASSRAVTAQHFRNRLEHGAPGAIGPVGKPPRRISRRGITDVVARVTKRLNARGLEDIERALLALPSVYEYLLIQALDEDKVQPDDELGLADAVMRRVRLEARHHVLTEMLGRVLDQEQIQLEPESLAALRQLLVDRKGISLRKGRVVEVIRELVNDGQELGGLRRWVDRFAVRGEIDDDLFTERIRNEMARFLLANRVHVADSMTFEAGEYDEYFALAFYHATRVSEGMDDPVDIARTKGAVADWDFTIRRISDLDRPVINERAIRAAGALYTIFVEGEMMRVFDIADSLLTDWHRGALDIPEGETASRLNRYEILMRDRPSEPERYMHYRRVFNIGDVEVLSGTVVNEAFPTYWDNMMYEVARWVDKIERYYSDEKVIRRTNIYHTIQDLQYNLSEYMTGSSPKKTTEMYRSLEEALDIIGSEDVLNHVGGRRKSILAVIERIGRESLGVPIPAQDLVTIAERGNDIFAFIAEFSAENVAEDAFQTFIDNCKAWITSQAAMESDGGPARAMPGEEDVAANGHGVASLNGQRPLAGVNGHGANGSFDDWES